MFTGIIETMGQIKEKSENKDNIYFWVESNISKYLKVNQSISHNGICLTVEEVKANRHKVTLVHKTLQYTNFLLAEIQNIPVNLERCLKMSDRLDGHFLQGHIDTTAQIESIEDKKGSWQYNFTFSTNHFKTLMIENGSIAVNGISLTSFNVTPNSFSVAIIPHTYSFTNLPFFKKGMSVNIEFDILGKYILNNFHSQTINK